MQLIGRQWALASEDYRFGFNGKEVDNDTYGEGNLYDYGFRIYNPRIGRFLSNDPLYKSFPWLTPYQFAANRPIISIDLDGLENEDVNGGNVSPDPSVAFKGTPTFNPIPNTPTAPPAGKAVGRNILKRGVENALKGSAAAIALTVVLVLCPSELNAPVPVNLPSNYPIGVQFENEFNDQSTPPIGPPWIVYADDPTTLSDEYLAEVQKRLSSGNADPTDFRYQGEINRRKGISPSVNSPSGSTTINLYSIRFSQNSVNGYYSWYNTFKSNGGWTGGPADIVKMEDGVYTTVDHTRLLVARDLGYDVLVVTHNYSDPIDGLNAERFKAKDGTLPTTWGEAVQNRINNQSQKFPKLFPKGTFNRPRINS